MPTSAKDERINFSSCSPPRDITLQATISNRFMNKGLDKEPEITNEYIAQIQKDGDKVTVKKVGSL